MADHVELEVTQIQKSYPNVWKPWLSDTQEAMKGMFEVDAAREVTSKKSKHKG